MSTVQERVFHVIAEQLGVGKSDVKPETTKDDLGMDSLDDVELVMALEDEFEMEVADSVSSRWGSVQDAIIYFQGGSK